MSDSAMDATATAHKDHLTEASVGSDQTVIAPPVDINMLPPVPGLAWFSTELGTRPPRKAPSPPFAPPIAYSDKIQAVVHTSHFWRRKYPRTAFALFPLCGWTIEDFWDAEDIHIYTEEHCREVLKFTTQDNVYRAIKFAEEWSIAHPERLTSTIGQVSMDDLYEEEEPLAIVDKLFTDGEINEFPRHFLWHALNIMRASMVKVMARKELTTATDSTPVSPLVQQELPVTTETPATPTDSVTTEKPATPIDSTDPGPANALLTQPIPPTDKEPKLSTTTYQAPAALIEHVPSSQNVPSLGEKRPLTYGPQQLGHYHGQPMGHIMAGMPTHAVGSPSMGGSALMSAKIRSGRSGSYNQTLPGAHGENLPHMPPSGTYYSRYPSESTLSAHSPHFNPAAMAMGPPAMPPPYPMHPHAPGYPPSSPSVYPTQPYHPGMVNPGMLLPHHNHMLGPPVAPGYIQQTSNVRGPRVPSMGDMTNTSYYINNGTPQNMDMHPTARRNSFYGSGNNSLYDPYNGTKPAFNDHNIGRKPGRGGFMEQQGRPRKPSVAEHRPHNGSYSNDWSNMPGNSNRFLDHRPPRAHMRDDPIMVNDPVRGCHQNWIGPENHNVNELFVSDLHDGVQTNEIQDMFVREIGITPVRVTVKHNPQGTRPHAFVLFTTASDAKLALRAGDINPKIRGIPVRVTVPRRFYQKAEGFHHPHESQQIGSMRNEERDTKGTARMPSHEEKSATSHTKVPIAQPMYSPQDARSDLQKKISSLSLEADAASRGSPKERKTAAHNISSAEQVMARGEDHIEEGSDEVAKSPVLLGITVEAKPSVQEASVAEDTTDLLSTTGVNDTEELRSPLANMRAVPANPNALVAGPPQPLVKQQATQMGHARIDSQSKATFEDAEEPPTGKEATTAVVKIPGTAKDIAVPTQQSSGILEVEKSKEKLHHDLEISPLDSPRSDDGADPDSSFISAQENVDPGKSTLDPGVESTTADHGTEPPKSVPETSFQKPSSFSQPPATQDSQHSPLPKHQEAVSTPISTLFDPPGGNDGMAVPAKNENAVAIKQPTYAEAVKQQGPQQTPSLNPFAKPSKSERKKEKELKKRELKKQQGEKATKAKAGKVSLTATSHVPEPAANLNSKEPINCLDLLKPNEEAPISKDKTKINVRQSDLSTLDQNSKAESKYTTFGKYIGDIVTETPSEIGLVTRMTIAMPEMMNTPKAKDFPVGPAPLSPAQLPKNEPGCAEKSTVTVKPLKVKVNDGLPATGIKETAPTLSDNNFDSRLPTTGAQNKHSDSTPNTAIPGPTELGISSKHVSLTPKNPGDSQPGEEMTNATREPKAASVASSDTINPNDGTDALPPSSSQAQAPKPKKKKKKNKKKKSAAAAGMNESTTLGTVAGPSTADAGAHVAAVKGTSSNVTGAYDYDADPFGHQMSHIDAIRAAAKKSDTYYNTVNRARAEKAMKQKADEDTAGKKNDKNTTGKKGDKDAADKNDPDKWYWLDRELPGWKKYLDLEQAESVEAYFMDLNFR